ncbi:hypothetical protein T459_08253 [Capsicum annuum]|uniref:Gnk2-homologous domain-containing protein n=1 Tax=Capsicum annuum TaxID=4072 RepID=A0A2G2ZW01_CAPAN|nr:hypothetical protein T459_08253 [Capsicum annuum]
MTSDLVLCSTQTILIFLLPWLLILSNILVDVKAQVYFSCSMGNYTERSKYQTNLNRLLYRSLYNNGGNSIYTKANEGEEPDKVYGVFLCRGDVAPKECQKCIDIASEQIPRECPLSKQAGVWYDECLVRYSNVSFAATLDVTVYLVSHRLGNVSRPEQFKGNLSAMFDNLITQATTVNSNLKYAGTNSDEPVSTIVWHGAVST